MDFHRSDRSTLGVEWELQLIDQESLDLSQSADEVMSELRSLPEDTSMVHSEMLVNTVELVSQPRKKVRECMRDLDASMQLVRTIAHKRALCLASAGTHPFAHPSDQKVTPSKRYKNLVDRTQWWGRQMLIFGTHVHVGVERREKVLPLLQAMLTRFAQLQALTAASPYWDGALTGYADNRAMMFQQLPTAGIPYSFHTWDQLETYVDDLYTAGIVQEFNEVRWDIRPSPGNGTLEMRMCDAATNIYELAMNVALTQCLVEYFSRLIDAGEPLPTLPAWFLEENKWRAARYGVDAVLIVDDSGRQEPVKETLTALVHQLAPIARELDCEQELMSVLHVLDVGAPYQRHLTVMRNHADDQHPMKKIVEYMLAEMEAGHPLDPHTWK